MNNLAFFDLSIHTDQVLFGTILREHRRELNVSAADLAGLCDISDTYLRMIETGVRAPRLLLLTALVHGLDGRLVELDRGWRVDFLDWKPFVVRPRPSRQRERGLRLEALTDRLEQIVLRLEALEKK